jgi:hypothetical protein
MVGGGVGARDGSAHLRLVEQYHTSNLLGANMPLADSVHMSTTPDMPSLYPSPGFEHYFKACRKGDPEAKTVTVN